MRVNIGFVCMLMTLWARPAAACDLAPTTRPETATGYWELTLECLRAPPAGVRFAADAEAEFARAINDARLSEGLRPLDIRSELVAAARFHSLDQIWNGTFGHDGAAGRSPFDRIAALDRTLIRGSARENVARAGGDFNFDAVPVMLHNGLMDSAGHRANILSDEVTHMAIGVARLSDRIVVTQLFVSVDGSLAKPAPLSMTPDDIYALSVMMERFAFARFRLRDAQGDIIDLPADDMLIPGRYGLSAVGRRPRDGGGFIETYLAGPEIDLVAVTP